MSSAIARNIFRMFSACCSSWLWVLNLDSLVTPSTSWATSVPNRSSTSVEGVVGVLGNVVEDRRGHRHGVDAEVGEDLRRGQRVHDVRLAGDAGLRRGGPARRTRTRPAGTPGPPAGSGGATESRTCPNCDAGVWTTLNPRRNPLGQRKAPMRRLRRGSLSLGLRGRGFDGHRGESSSRGRRSVSGAGSGTARPGEPRLEPRPQRPSSDCRSTVPTSVTPLVETMLTGEPERVAVAGSRSAARSGSQAVPGHEQEPAAVSS